MSQAKHYIPERYSNVVPYLTVSDAKAALDFYQRALGANIVMVMEEPSGRVAHAEISIGGTIIMLSDEFLELGAVSPTRLGGRTSSLMVYVSDVDAFLANAIAQGGALERPAADQFYGDRTGGFKDPFGHSWYIATHIEDVPEEELKQRMKGE